VEEHRFSTNGARHKEVPAFSNTPSVRKCGKAKTTLFAVLVEKDHGRTFSTSY
jgi:hypothetical protein